MEYIQHSEFEQLSVLLTNLTVGTYNISGKIEAFSSSIKNERVQKQQQQQQQIANDDVMLQEYEPIRRQRSQSFGSYNTRKYTRRRASSLGDLSEPSSRILFMDFINALNEAFPDYDFGYSKLHQFKDQDTPIVMSLVNNYLAEITVTHTAFLEKLWNSIDEIVNLRQCEIFSYHPDHHDDEQYANIWEFHYFFFNKSVNRLCYFTCGAQSVFRMANKWGMGLYDQQEEDGGEGSDSDFEAEDEDNDRMDGMEMDDDEDRLSKSNISRLCDVEDEMEEEDEENEVPDWDGII